MSTFKKVISIVLCIAMLAGSFAMLGGLATPEASAAEGTSQVDSYESLAAAYDNFVYLGSEFYELDITVNDDGTYSDPQNQELTDYYVDAGQILEARMYIKSDMFMGNGTFVIAYDNSFFDVTHPVLLAGNTTLSNTGYYVSGAVGVVNTNHPVYISNGIKNSLSTGECGSVAWFGNRTDYTDAELASWSFTQKGLSYTDNGTNLAYQFTSDDWVYSWYVKVKDDVTEGTTGVTETKAQFWKCDDKTAATKVNTWSGRNGTFNILPLASGTVGTTTVGNVSKNCYTGYDLFNYFLFDDLKHTFTCGKNPNEGGSTEPTGPVAGTSQVDSYESLAAAYDNFVYLGSEFYEIDITVNEDGTYGEASNHILTDYYVDAGQILEARMYIKSDMFMGNGTFVIAYDNSFFDVTHPVLLAGNTILSNTGYYVSGAVGVVNTNHPVYISNGIKNSLSTGECGSVAWFGNRTDYTDAELASWSFTQKGLSYTDNGTNLAYQFTSDDWVYSWYVKVKDDVTEGTTGVTETKAQFWKCDDKTAATKVNTWSGRNGTFNILPLASGTVGTTTVGNVSKNCYTGYDLFNYFLFDDLKHTFTCGKNPNAGGSTVKKYTVSFVENDGTPISSAEYVKDAAVAVPAEVENQAGWANSSTGKMVDLTDYKATTNVEFKRILSTDEFTVTVNLSGGEYADGAPEGTTVENGSLIVKGNINEEIDFTKIPVPEKAGYTGAWDAESVKIDNIKGVTAGITWTANEYTVKFYNNKTDAEPFATQKVVYSKPASTKDYTVPAGYKFAGWADMDTDEIVSTTERITYNFAEDKSFYATWTKYDSSMTFMVRDYEAGSGWVVGSVVYGDSGSTLKKADVVKALEAAATSIDATVACMPATTTPELYSNAETTNDAFVGINSGLKYNGDTVYYLCTSLVFNVTWKVPVFDESTGTFSGYTETTGTASTGATTSIYSVSLKTTADTTPPAGYTFNGWVNEATGEAVEYNNVLGVTLDYTYDRDVVFVADFAETEYTIAFNMQNKYDDGKLTMDDTFKVGEDIVIEGATFTSAQGNAATLPVVGVENSQQATKFMNMNGYKFLGWKIGTGANAKDITFPEELTYDMIADYASGTTITIYAQWEALEYELRFFYALPDTDLTADVEDREYTDEPYVVTYKTGEEISRDVDEDTLTKIEANTPEGYKFLQWRRLDGATIGKYMPAFGLDLYATYLPMQIDIYVDYNNNPKDEDGNDLPLSETLRLAAEIKQNPVYYGDDVEAEEDLDAGIAMGTGTLIKRQIMTDGNKPGENYEVVAWNIYHVEAGKDVYDKNNWKPGINDEGTTNAYTTLIYQPEWKHHSEFFFRIYGTDGKIYSALGKNFKLYYWENNYVCERGDTKINKDPENSIIFFYIPTIENWDWDRFFDCDMWSSVTLRIDPFDVPKSALTVEAFIGLMSALGTLIKNLL